MSEQQLTHSSKNTMEKAKMTGEVIHKFPITVSYSMGATINLGNYETVRVQCGLSIPIYDGKKFDSAKQKVTEIVEEWLYEEVEKQVQKHKQDGKEVDEIVFEELV